MMVKEISAKRRNLVLFSLYFLVAGQFLEHLLGQPNQKDTKEKNDIAESARCSPHMWTLPRIFLSFYLLCVLGSAATMWG